MQQAAATRGSIVGEKAKLAGSGCQARPELSETRTHTKGSLVSNAPSVILCALCGEWFFLLLHVDPRRRVPPFATRAASATLLPARKVDKKRADQKGELRKMSSRRFLISTFVLLLCLSFAASAPLSAADKKSKDAPAKTKETSKPSYELPQPATETLDLTMYQRIREEGLDHSHVMDYATALMDGIGPRLTGSPNLKRANEWTRDQFTAMGCKQRSSRRLGRVRHGMAAAQHLGPHVGSRHRGVHRAGAALVSRRARDQSAEARSG